MNRRIALVLAVTAFAAAKPLAAQYYATESRAGSFTVDSTLAAKGRRVFAARACQGCHTIGKGDLSAPDLAGVLERRSESWVRKWLRDPTPMLEKDDTARQMLSRYNIRMPNLKLTDEEIQALLHHIAAETAAARQGAPPSQ